MAGICLNYILFFCVLSVYESHMVKLENPRHFPDFFGWLFILGIIFFPFSAFFLDFCFPASLLFSSSAFCYFVFPCLSAFTVL